MKIYSSYGVRIPDRCFNKAFADTAEKYRAAVDFFIQVVINEWATISSIKGSLNKRRKIEFLTIKTKDNQNPKYDFGLAFYKFPCYYRRAAIAEALGTVTSYESNLANWEETHEGKAPQPPKAGITYPTLYRDNTYVRVGDLAAEVKVWINNTWDWVTIPLRKTDVSYIQQHCSNRTECVPTLQKRYKVWELQFSFEEEVNLSQIASEDQIVLAVDLGINSACVCTAMCADGTIVGRKFLDLPTEEDSLHHALNKIKKAQQHGNRKTPKLWAKAKGINDKISVLTAQFIADAALLYCASTVVFEHLETRGKKKGCRRMRQRIHHWRAQYVQKMVTDKVHRLGIHVLHVNAWCTSKLAFDGSGRLVRGKEAGFDTAALCRFQNGKIYNCDLNASYNIGARYFIREILKSLPAKVRLRIEAKVPQCSKRSTCTLSTLISLNAELNAILA